MRISGAGGSGAPTGWPLTWYGIPPGGVSSNAQFAAPVNTLNLYGFVLPASVQFNKIVLSILTLDAANLYDFGFYSYGGALVAHIGAQAIPATGVHAFAVVGGPITLNPGRYFVASTGNSTTAQYTQAGGAGIAWNFQAVGGFGTSAAGVLPGTITPPADLLVLNSGPAFALTI